MLINVVTSILIITSFVLKRGKHIFGVFLWIWWLIFRFLSLIRTDENKKQKKDKKKMKWSDSFLRIVWWIILSHLHCHIHSVNSTYNYIFKESTFWISGFFCKTDFRTLHKMDLFKKKPTVKGQLLGFKQRNCVLMIYFIVNYTIYIIEIYISWLNIFMG